MTLVDSVVAVKENSCAVLRSVSQSSTNSLLSFREVDDEGSLTTIVVVVSVTRCRLRALCRVSAMCGKV